MKLPKKFGKLQHLMTPDLVENSLDSSNTSLDVTALLSLRSLTLPCDPTCLELRNGVSNLRELLLTASGGFRDEDSETKTLKYDTLAASLVMLGNSNLHWLSINFSTPEQFWNHSFACPHHLQLIWCNNMKTLQVPKWMAQADRLAYLEELKVEQLLSEDLKVLVHMPCLPYLSLETETVPEKSILIRSNTFPVLKKFEFSYKSSYLTFELGAMPRLKKLHINYDSSGPGSEHEVSPVAGVEHLASLDDVYVVVYAKRGEGPSLSLYTGNPSKGIRDISP